MTKSKISGIIFDMDGVISDTQKLHAKVEAGLLAGYGVVIAPEEITRKYAGTKTRRVFDDLLGAKGVTYDIDKILEEKWRQLDVLAAQSVEQVEGSVELISKLHAEGFKMAVASASIAQYVKTVVKSLDVEKYFNFLASGDMVTNGKPDPEIFLLAASKLGIEPAKCVVIEDGINGMEAARAANMKCIDLVGSAKGDYPTQNLVSSLKEITCDYLDNLA